MTQGIHGRLGRRAAVCTAMLATALTAAAAPARADHGWYGEHGASAIISNGTIQLGVWNTGHLNVPGDTPSLGGTTTVGLRHLPTGAEATAPGCLCEGWGVADARSGSTGYANESADGGAQNLDRVSFEHTDSTATSVVDIDDKMRVTHEYRPSARTANLYEAVVTITNIGSEPVQPRYRRVMDWDIEPTPFREWVTINGGNSEDLLYASDNGFATADPLGGRTYLVAEGDQVDSGPADHGALFDFGFAELAPGESKRFRIYYGAAGTEAGAVDALGSVSPEVFSFGQPTTQTGKDNGDPNTFVFAFGGVGGDPVIGCGEDGLQALDDTPAAGTLSGTLHDTVEPAAGQVHPDLEGGVHDASCNVVVPAENQLDDTLTGRQVEPLRQR